MNEMIKYFGKDVRRINHALKVYSFASLIATYEVQDQFSIEVVAYSSLLHDIGIKNSEIKYGSSSGNYQEIEGPPVVKEILASLKIDNAVIDRVCFLVAHHHTYNKIDGTDFRILVEADFLVNVFEDGLEQNTIKNVYNNVFKTEAGRNLLKTMYMKED
jgi:HD superfamily phosphodiesterase